MEYNVLYDILKERFDKKSQYDIISELNLTIETLSFTSKSSNLLYGSPQYSCNKHGLSFSTNEDGFYVQHGLSDVEAKDFDIESNKTFEYYILKRADIDQTDGAIIFFHGLNEKKWDKYLPWAYEFAQQTRKAVILFPIAFHMNRAEETWSDRHKMVEIANFRTKKFKENSDCSFVNSAISSRLEAHPQRIFWSGFQTYSDVINLVHNVRDGKINSISKFADFDLFGYSIGSFLSIIIKMANPSDIFKRAKLFCFCGGMTIDRMFPISRYIMDARAAIKMQTTFAELLSSDFKSDIRLGHFQNVHLHPQESWFKTMLRYNYYQKERENRIKEIQSDIKAYVLEKDEVAPPMEALNTLQGGYRNINVEVEIQDFDYEYSHVNPFPTTTKNQDKVTFSFQQFVKSACDFYNS